jgi:hypothetical protein
MEKHSVDAIVGALNMANVRYLGSRAGCRRDVHRYSGSAAPERAGRGRPQPAVPLTIRV